jgi:hypothetical protein
MDVGVEVLVGCVAVIAAALAGFRLYGRRQIIKTYQDGRALRLAGDYDSADKMLSVASIGFPSARVLRFWMMLEKQQVDDARVPLTEIPRTLAGQECATWLALRHDRLSAAEQEVGKLMQLMDMNKEAAPWLMSSAIYTHACLMIEEDSLNYATEKLSASIQIARRAYGPDSIYAVPQAVALSYLHFIKGNFEKSGSLLSVGLRAYSKALGPDHPRTARLRAMLGIVAGAVGVFTEPRAELNRATQALAKHGLQDTKDAQTIKRAALWLDGLAH